MEIKRRQMLKMGAAGLGAAVLGVKAAAATPACVETAPQTPGPFYPGEDNHQALPRSMFNGLCAGCHGSITGREVDIAVNIDILTSASKTVAHDMPATVLLTQ